MATFEHRVGNKLPSTGRVTVAELMRRNLPAQRTSSPDAAPVVPEQARPVMDGAALAAIHTAASAEVVSVGSLLRREGRIDVPAPAPAAVPTPRGPARTAAKRSAIAAGTLLAAGSVLGVAVLTNASSGSSEAQASADGSFPGQRLPDGADPASAAFGSDALDAGTAAPGSWMNVAFPSALSPAATGPAASATSAPAAGGNFVGPVGPAAGGRTATNPGATPAAPAPAVSRPAGPVGQATQTVGRQVVAPVTHTVDAVTAPVTSTLDTAGKALKPTTDKVLAPVASAAKPVTETLRQASQGTVKPLTDTLRPVSQPLAKAAAPISGPVTRTVDRLAAPVTNLTAPLSKPVQDAVAPVTGSLLGTSDDGSAQPESVVGNTAKALGGALGRK
ncbi:hypothetical protein [Pseudonocardia sp.]|uniref:hypothetical protein n=1 Tax=Pseudonocardia sp. TaxID=60912 RepID=UPI0031FE2601